MPWSDWQTGFSFLQPCFASGEYGRKNADNSTGTFPGDTVESLLAALKTSLNADGGTVTDGYVGAGNSLQDIARVAGDQGDPTFRGATLEFGYAARVWDILNADPGGPYALSPLLSTLVFGVDYGPIPDAHIGEATFPVFGLVDYSDPAVTGEGWAAFKAAGSMGLQQQTQGTVFDTDPTTTPLHLHAVADMGDNAGPDEGAAVLYSDGDPVIDVDFPLATPFDGSPHTSSFAPADADISGLSLPDRFTGVWRSRYAGDIDPLYDTSDFYDIRFSLTRGSVANYSPNASWATSTWRYWIPEAGWHRIGGHLGNFGAGQRFIKTNGVMLPVLDGLAS